MPNTTQLGTLLFANVKLIPVKLGMIRKTRRVAINFPGVKIVTLVTDLKQISECSKHYLSLSTCGKDLFRIVVF